MFINNYIALRDKITHMAFGEGLPGWKQNLPSIKQLLQENGKISKLFNERNRLPVETSYSIDNVSFGKIIQKKKWIKQWLEDENESMPLYIRIHIEIPKKIGIDSCEVGLFSKNKLCFYSPHYPWQKLAVDKFPVIKDIDWDYTLKTILVSTNNFHKLYKI